MNAALLLPFAFEVAGVGLCEPAQQLLVPRIGHDVEVQVE